MHHAHAIRQPASTLRTLCRGQTLCIHEGMTSPACKAHPPANQSITPASRYGCDCLSLISRCAVADCITHVKISMASRGHIWDRRAERSTRRGGVGRRSLVYVVMHECGVAEPEWRDSGKILTTRAGVVCSCRREYLEGRWRFARWDD